MFELAFVRGFVREEGLKMEASLLPGCNESHKKRLKSSVADTFVFLVG